MISAVQIPAEVHADTIDTIDRYLADVRKTAVRYLNKGYRVSIKSKILCVKNTLHKEKDRRK